MRKSIKQYALAAVLIVAVVAVVVVVVYLAKGEKITSISINPNSMLAGAGTVYVPARLAFAYIATPSAVATINSQRSCDGKPSPRCEILSVASESQSVTRKEPPPYSPGGNYTLVITEKKNYTSQFAARYGLSSCTETTSFDSRANKNITRYSCIGPKGYTSDPVERPGPPMSGISIDQGSRGVSVSYGTYGGETRTREVYTPTEIFRISAQSSKLLVMGGKFSVKYKVTISVSASTLIFNSNPYTSSIDFDDGDNVDYVDPRSIADNPDISCRNIRIAGKALGSNCEITVLINGQQKLDVTPVVRGPLYAYTVSVVKVEEPAGSTPETVPVRDY